MSDATVHHNNVDALVWLDTSAEQHALYLQAFELARLRVESALRSLPAESLGKKPCVFTDCDETVLDNSLFNYRLVRLGETFTEDGNWANFCRQQLSRATPGAVEFASFLRSVNVSLFFVTSRKNDVREATAANLSALGFHVEHPGTPSDVDIDRTNLFMKGVLIDGKPSRKFEQYAHVIDKRGYYPLLWLGDNLGDFDPAYKVALSADRTSVVANDHNQRLQIAATRDAACWGRKWIVMPNPVYGDFIDGLHARTSTRRIVDGATAPRTSESTPKLASLTDVDSDLA